MVHGCQKLCFPLKAAKAIGIVGKMFGQEFEGDITLKLDVARPKDDTHPAFAKLGCDFVRADARAGCDGHKSAMIISAHA